MCMRGQQCKQHTKSERRSETLRYWLTVLEMGNGVFREGGKVEDRRKQVQNPQGRHSR